MEERLLIMIAIPALLVNPAEEAGMKVPDDPEDFDAEEFPHFHVFLLLQLGRRMPTPSAHWENAKIVAAVPDAKIKKMTAADFNALGFE